MGAEIVTRNVNLSFTEGTIEAFVAEPSGGDGFPAIVVIHEWWGLNDHIRDIANRLASEGFTVIAPDLFDGLVTIDEEVASSLMMGLDQQEVLVKLDSAVAFVSQEGRTNVGVMGFCMGGSYALMLPTSNSRVAAAVPFYGQVPADDVLDSISSPVLYIYAGKDQWITKGEVDRLSAHLTAKGKPGKVVHYPNCDHAFFNDTRPEVYDAINAEDAWKRVLEFLKANLSNEKVSGSE